VQELSQSIRNNGKFAITPSYCFNLPAPPSTSFGSDKRSHVAIGRLRTFYLHYFFITYWLSKCNALERFERNMSHFAKDALKQQRVINGKMPYLSCEK
jgi:hypothetical protein